MEEIFRGSGSNGGGAGVHRAFNCGSDDVVPSKGSKEVATRMRERLEQMRRCAVTDYASCD